MGLEDARKADVPGDFLVSTTASRQRAMATGEAVGSKVKGRREAGGGLAGAASPNREIRRLGVA